MAEVAKRMQPGRSSSSVSAMETRVEATVMSMMRAEMGTEERRTTEV